MKQTIHLDFAAGTPVDKNVASLVYEAMLLYGANPSALYHEGKQAKQALEDARKSVARSLGCRSSEIIFTAGGTESTNFAIQGVMRAFPDGHLVMTAIEHDAVFEPAQLFSHDVCEVDQNGLLNIQDLQKRIRDNTVLISIMYVNNEVGTIQPLNEVVNMVKTIRRDRQSRGVKTPLYVHTDACQAAQYLDCSPSKLGIDLMTLNGGKMHGPKQSGILYVRAGTTIQPLIRGGGQEFGLRSGTEHVALAVGFAKSLEMAISQRQDNVEHVRDLSLYFRKELEKRFFARLNGHQKLRVPNNVHVTFEGTDNERVLFALDQLGVQASAGSACQASKDTPSRVLQAMGFSEEDAQSSIRFSLGKTTTRYEIEYVLDVLEKALQM